MPGIAFTDHGVMYGVIEFYNAAIAEGIKPIIGIEAYISARRVITHLRHLTFLNMGFCMLCA